MSKVCQGSTSVMPSSLCPLRHHDLPPAPTNTQASNHHPPKINLNPPTQSTHPPIQPIIHSTNQPPDQALYDLVYEAPPDSAAPACSKVHRDTHNRTMLSRDRSLGGRLTTQRLHFAAPAAPPPKPEFARRPLIRDTFYRRTNVAFPADCDAAGGQQ